MLTQNSGVLKMNSLSYSSIVQSDYFLGTYFAYILNNITIELKMSWKITIFDTLAKNCRYHQLFTRT